MRQLKVLMNLIRDALKELSDSTYQQRVWVVGSPTEVSSLTEATCALFDDSGLDTALEKNAITFSPEIDTELRELQFLLRKCLDREAQTTIQHVLASPEWDVVCQKAASLYGRLTASGHDFG